MRQNFFYGFHMEETSIEKLKNRVLVSAIEHDYARVWLLHENSTEPVVTVNRPGVRQMHVRSSQERHMHASETGETEYFTTLASVLENGSEVLLVGHGKGNGNMMNKFLKFLADQSPVKVHIAASGNADLSALTNGQLLQEARHQWERKL